MKKLVIAAVATTALLAATPALAQFGFYAGPGGVGVQVGPSYGYHDGPYGYYRTEPRYYARSGRYWRDRAWGYRPGGRGGRRWGRRLQWARLEQGGGFLGGA